MGFARGTIDDVSGASESNRRRDAAMAEARARLDALNRTAWDMRQQQIQGALSYFQPVVARANRLTGFSAPAFQPQPFPGQASALFAPPPQQGGGGGGSPLSKIGIPGLVNSAPAMAKGAWTAAQDAFGMTPLGSGVAAVNDARSGNWKGAAENAFGATPAGAAVKGAKRLYRGAKDLFNW